MAIQTELRRCVAAAMTRQKKGQAVNVVGNILQCGAQFKQTRRLRGENSGSIASLREAVSKSAVWLEFRNENLRIVHASSAIRISKTLVI